jgi:YggT family protein
MGTFLYIIVNWLIGAIIVCLIANAVLSWLVAFSVINVRHPFVLAIVRFLEAVTRPVLAPFRRFIPPLGGVDITPILAWLVLMAFQATLLPMIFAPLRAALG